MFLFALAVILGTVLVQLTQGKGFVHLLAFYVAAGALVVTIEPAHHVLIARGIERPAFYLAGLVTCSVLFGALLASLVPPEKK